MENKAHQDDERWEQVTENVDLLFASMGEVKKSHTKLETKLDMTTKVMEQMMKDQQHIAKTLELTGQAVAQLTLKKPREKQEEPQSPTDSDTTIDEPFRGQRKRFGGAVPRTAPSTFYQHQHKDPGGWSNMHHTHWPKMQFPRFDGNNPSIWRDKCQDYFRLFDLPESMWTTLASLHMDEMPSKWLKGYKVKHGLDDWNAFISAVEQKFGYHDYEEAIEALLELQQNDMVEVYVAAFENL